MMEWEEVLLLDVTPLAIGVETGGGVMTAAICLVVTIGAGMLGTWLALSQKPAPLLRNE